MDRLDPIQRSRLMSRIRRSDTKPERVVRSLLHALGYRFRTQLKGVPGRPDVAFPRRRKAILVHGCFWHQHAGCRHAGVPATRTEFWQAKFERNRERDERLLRAAEALGWEMLVVWECETKAVDLDRRLKGFLGPPRAAAPGSP
jgi:DNA mismatch endonuclease, patch repair protein